MLRSQYIVGCIVLALCASTTQAQAPGMEWQRSLGGGCSEISWGVQATSDGGYTVLGTTCSNDGDVSGNHGGFDFWLTKLNSQGASLWQHCYGGTGSETAKGLLATTDSGFLLLGSTGSTDGDVDCANAAAHPWALKVDSMGTIQWQVCMGTDPDGSGGTLGCAVETADGGYIAIGATFADMGVWHENHGGSDFFAVKLNGAGEVQWLHCYGGPGGDGAYAIQGTPDNGFAIAGVCGAPGGQVTNGEQGSIWVIKIDADGNLLWNRRMGGAVNPGTGQEVRDLVMNPDGSMLVVGTVGANDGDISGNHGSFDVWLVRLDSGGAILQQRCFGGSGWDVAWGGAVAEQDHYVIAGYTQSNDGDVSGNHGGAGQDAWVFKVDADLNLLWQKCLGGSASDMAYAMANTPGNGVIISGSTGSNDGDVSGYQGSGDIWVAKLAADLDAGIQTSGGADFSVFPSPANDVVNIRLPNSLPFNTTLDVVDITGRVVLQNKLQAGQKSLKVDVAHWAEGVYCLRLDMGTAVRSTRFVKQ